MSKKLKSGLVALVVAMPMLVSRVRGIDPIRYCFDSAISGLLRLVALALVARMAKGTKVFHIRPTACGYWHDVINHQLSISSCVATENTNESISAHH